MSHAHPSTPLQPLRAAATALLSDAIAFGFRIFRRAERDHRMPARKASKTSRLVLPFALTSALALSGCLHQHAVYTFSPDGTVTVESTLSVNAGVLEGMPEEERRAFVEETLFSELGEREIVKYGANQWRSTGPPVALERFAQFMREQGTVVTGSETGYRFTSSPAETKKFIRQEILTNCADGLPPPVSPALCETVSEMLLDPGRPIDPGVLAPLLSPETGLTGHNLAAMIHSFRNQLAGVTLLVELRGEVQDVIGFGPGPTGGWTRRASLYDTLDTQLEWTVPAGQTAGPKNIEAILDDLFFPGRSAGPKQADAGTRLNPAKDTAAQTVLPTPEVRRIEDTSGEFGTDVAYLLRARVGGGPDRIGVALTCFARERRLEVAAHFGGFPEDGRRVQLAVRDGQGRIERFGPVVRGTPRSGFHSPRIDDRTNALRFAAALFTEGALLSNGYRSLRNRAGAQANALAHRRLVACANGHG